MKKQFMRYKLIADQKVGRANKSEVLNDEMLQVEKHMEHVRVACQSTYKKLSQCLQTHSIGEYEKRIKRVSEHVLGQGMLDASKSLLSESDSNQTLGSSLRVCGEAQIGLAKEKAMYEMFVDEHVIAPLQTLVESEIPSIMKQRERLKKLVLDRDGAYQNWNKVHKSQFTPGANLQQITAKSEILKDEYDQAVIRMEQSKDQLVTDLFEFLAKEAGHGQRMSDFHAKQLDYHRRCVDLLEKMKPDMDSVQDNAVMKSAFGLSLSDHLRLTQREIASPIEACVLCLLEFGLKEEGLFRIGGGAAKLKKFRALADGGVLDFNDYDAQDDIHAVAGALKQYLRELPNPLLTHELHDEWIAASSISDNDAKLQQLWTVIDKLPAENKANLKYLIKFCAVVAEHQDVNKMSPGNIALVLAPNLLWSHIDDIGKRMMESNLMANVVESIITYSDWFFPGDFDFVVTPNATTYSGSHRDSSQFNDFKVPTPVSPSTNHKTHSRNSSTDYNLSDSSSGTVQSPAGKQRKMKSKAPPPPTANTKNTDQKSSPPNSHPPSSGGGNTTKPPIAAKRTSMRRPQLPPPQPPKEDPVLEEEASKSRPIPPVRKRQSHHSSNEQLNSAPRRNSDDSPVEEPPMPNLPPPPLPEDFDPTEGLASELQKSSSIHLSDEEEEDVIMTPL
nr:rho GTPase-activating protein 17 isoform X1 [Ciona intestinalis]|eukprot:XP_009858035.1 rho GTPase-activating protein 17 isoform X1 [Ciona intestinalis]